MSIPKDLIPSETVPMVVWAVEPYIAKAQLGVLIVLGRKSLDVRKLDPGTETSHGIGRTESPHGYRLHNLARRALASVSTYVPTWWTGRDYCLRDDVLSPLPPRDGCLNSHGICNGQCTRKQRRKARQRDVPYGGNDGRVLGWEN